MNAVPRWRGALGLLVGPVVVLAVLAVVVTWPVRRGLHVGVLAREAEAVQAVVQLVHTLEAEERAALGLAPTEEDALAIALQASRLRGVVGVRLYAPNGAAGDGLPAWAPEPTLTDAEREHLAQGQPRARLLTGANALMLRDDLAGRSAPDLAADAGRGAGSLLEVLTPLPGPDPEASGGAARFWMAGGPVAAELAAVDRRLFGQAASVVGAGAAALLLVGGWSLRRVARSQAALEARSAALAAANRELSLAARTSALGAVAAHLVHGLRNGLGGLEQAADAGNDAAGAAEIAAAARRLRRMVDGVVDIVREEQGGALYDTNPEEIAAWLGERLAEAARNRGVRLELLVPPGPGEAEAGSLEGRTANLVFLALLNLAENAVAATPAGGTVRLELSATAAEWTWRLADTGPGLPTSVRERLFLPGSSVRGDGSGIGLALAHELARRAGAVLELEATGPAGTTFRLRLPRPVAAAPATARVRADFSP